MQIVATGTPFKVAGILIRTTNDRAFDEIPAHWQRFYETDVCARIANKVGADVYAVYTDFEHKGVDNLGTYSMVIGVPVTQVSAQAGIVTVAVPASRRAVFSIERGHPEKVGDAWREIWCRNDFHKTFVCDYERYQPDGTIDIHVGIR